MKLKDIIDILIEHNVLKCGFIIHGKKDKVSTNINLFPSDITHNALLKSLMDLEGANRFID